MMTELNSHRALPGGISPRVMPIPRGLQVSLALKECDTEKDIIKRQHGTCPFQLTTFQSKKMFSRQIVLRR